MHVVVYDAAAERNPKILRTCRQSAQLRRFQHTFAEVLDLTYDSVIVYTFPPGATPQRLAWGNTEPEPTDIL